MSVRPLRHDPLGVSNLLHGSLVSLLDSHDRVSEELLQVPLVLPLVGQPAAAVATDLVKDQPLDVEASGVVFFHEPVVAEQVAQIVAKTHVVGVGRIAAAISAIAMEGDVRHESAAILVAFASFQEVIQPTRVLGHCWRDEGLVSLCLGLPHLVCPNSDVGGWVGSQVPVGACLTGIIRLVPALHHCSAATIGARWRKRVDIISWVLEHRHVLDKRILYLPMRIPVVLPNLTLACERHGVCEVSLIKTVASLLVDGHTAESQEVGVDLEEGSL
mmetsp:Transcript_82129/g.171940  ORF Transcript_82129/g.171940 Transcript_82129/m.171940 type:complete len:273 (-) Transcript_82129:327-1145(-)